MGRVHRCWQEAPRRRPDSYITNDIGDPGFTTSMIWQAGGQPYKVDGHDVHINLADEGSKKWTGTGTTWSRTSSSPRRLVERRVVQGACRRKDRHARDRRMDARQPRLGCARGRGKWRVAPMPTYEGKPAAAENGGGGDALIKQSKNKLAHTASCSS